MACTKPITAYRSLINVGNNGNAEIYFRKPQEQGNIVEEIELPCGQCTSCRISKSREWALRCAHEASLWEQNCFITLTFAENAMPISTRECQKCEIYQRRIYNANKQGIEISEREAKCEEGSVCKRDFQLFMKALRTRFKGYEPVGDSNHHPIRYFQCGEYGHKLQRPHHHALLFNFNFPDRYLWKSCDLLSSAKKGTQSYNLYRSPILESLWPHGFSTIGEVNWHSAAYVARYATKKITGDEAAVHYLSGHPDIETGECFYLEPEYVSMSKEPGIGGYWFQKYGKQQYEKNYITHRGREFAIPKYYDKLMARTDPELVKASKLERRQRACERQPKEIKERIKRNQAKETILEQRFKKLMRSLENDNENVQRL